MDELDLCFAGAAEQARLVRAGEVSARELIEATLRRITAIDPHMNAYRVVFAEQALELAAMVDTAHDTSDPRRLLGVPIAIKDDTDVAGEITAWGTDAYGAPAANDAEVVRRLRAEGAIVIGKTHVPEMTAWPWTDSATWGPTRNPWDLARSPGGSSGGAAAAAATGMCGVALGSDGGGSVRYPAAVTGLFGLKPGRDRIPLDAHRADAWNGLLAYGSLSRTVRDAALFLDTTAGTDCGFALASPIPRLRVAVSFDPPHGSFAKLRSDRRRAVERVVALLHDLGHDVVEREIDYGGAMANSTIRYLDGVSHDVHTMARPERLERTTRRLARLGSSIPRRTVAAARAREADVARRMNAVFEHADLVLTPMAGQPPPSIAARPTGLLGSLLHANVAAWAVPWNVIGQPAASIPAGLDDDGLPLAVQLGARSDHEPILLNLAAQIETAQPWHRHRPPSPPR